MSLLTGQSMAETLTEIGREGEMSGWMGLFVGSVVVILVYFTSGFVYEASQDTRSPEPIALLVQLWILAAFGGGLWLGRFL